MRSKLLIPLLVFVFLFYGSEAYAGTKKSQLVFKLNKSYQGFPYCSKIGSQWVAATKYSKGKVTLASRSNKKANSNCKTRAARMLKASITYARLKSKSSTSRSSAQIKESIREVTMIDPRTREPYVVYFLADIQISSIIGLPNNYSFIYPAGLSATVSGTTCRDVLLTPTGDMRCIPESLVGLVIENGESNVVKAGRSFQQDSEGNTYFWALEYVTGTGLPQLIKMTPSGEFSAIYRALLTESAPIFHVKPDGSVVFFSFSSSLDVIGIHQLDPAHNKSTLIENALSIAGGSVGYLVRYPGDSFLAGLTNFVNGLRSDPVNARIIKINNNSYENIISAAAHSPTISSTESICTGAGAELTSFCVYGGTQIASSHTTSEAAYMVMAQPPLEGNARRVLMRIRDTGIQRITLSMIDEPREVSGFGDHLIIAGKTTSGGGRIIHYNALTGSEAILVDGITVSDNPGNLFYSIRTGAILGSGTRDSDSRGVIVQIPISSTGPSAGLTARLPTGLDGISFSY